MSQLTAAKNNAHGGIMVMAVSMVSILLLVIVVLFRLWMISMDDAKLRRLADDLAMGALMAYINSPALDAAGKQIAAQHIVDQLIERNTTLMKIGALSEHAGQAPSAHWQTGNYCASGDTSCTPGFVAGGTPVNAVQLDFSATPSEGQDFAKQVITSDPSSKSYSTIAAVNSSNVVSIAK